jgi:hypothetical protein
MGMEKSSQREFPSNKLGRMWHLSRDQGIFYDFVNGWYTCFNFCPELCLWLELSFFFFLFLFLFFFFFDCPYNPLCVLAFSVIFFHSALSLHNFLYPLIPIICISSSVSSIHLFLGLPLFLLPIGFHSFGYSFFFHLHHVTQPSHSFVTVFLQY